MLVLSMAWADGPHTPSKTEMVLQRFHENFSEGMAGRVGGLVAVQLGQRMRDLATGVVGPALAGFLPGPLARVVGPILAEFTTTAVSKVGFDLATDLYKRKVKGQTSKGVDVTETVVAAAGSTLGTALLSAVIGPLAGRWLGGWLGWNIGVALLGQARKGKAADIGAALATLNVPRMLIEQAAMDTTTKLSRQIFTISSLSALASAPLGTPVQFLATLVFASFGSALALALYDTAMAPPDQARGSVIGIAQRHKPSARELVRLKSDLDLAYTRYVTAEANHGPFNRETRDSLRAYLRAQRDYRDSVEASWTRGR